MNHIHIEFNEIKKALDKAIAPAEKSRTELMDSNRKVLEYILNSDKNSVKLLKGISTSTTDLMNSLKLNNSVFTSSMCSSQLSNKSHDGIEFQIGNSVQSNGEAKLASLSNVLCFGEGDNIKTLIDDNENLRVRYSIQYDHYIAIFRWKISYFWFCF